MRLLTILMWILSTSYHSPWLPKSCTMTNRWGFICCRLWRHINTPSSTGGVIMYYTKLVPDKSLLIMLEMLLIYGYVPCIKYNWIEPSKDLLLFNMLSLEQHMWSSSITILVRFHISLKLYFTDQDIYMSSHTLVPSRYHNTCFVHVYVQIGKHITDPGTRN